MKFVRLNWCLGEICTYDPNDDDTNEDYETNDDARWTKHDCIKLMGIMQNAQKKITIEHCLCTGHNFFKTRYFADFKQQFHPCNM